MALFGESDPKQSFTNVLRTSPGVRISLTPIAPPAALGLAGFAGSTFVAASWIVSWWGNASSPTTFFPFVAIFGGLAQFIAGLHGFAARDTLVTIVNTMWGSFWMSAGLLWAFVAAGAFPPSEIHSHSPELASWFVVLMAFTWSAAIASTSRDAVLMACLFSLAIGTTVACCLFGYNSASSDGVTKGIKAAAYCWLFSALCAWWRVTVFLMEEAYGAEHWLARFFPTFKTGHEKKQPHLVSGVGEPGVTRSVPKE